MTVEEMALAGILPRPDHSIKRVTSPTVNPTTWQDEVLFYHSEPNQYPPAQGDIRTIYAHDLTEPPADDDYPWFGGELVRCSREKQDSLHAAQAFFNRQRFILRWTHEGPIYRTGRYWCKRVWRNGRDD